MISNVLSIAGSDPSGGAGIQADLKTFSALGCYGMCVITSLTAQNTLGVQDIYEVSPDFVWKQIESVFKDIRVDAMKIGMLGEPEVVSVIVDAIKTYKPAHVVLDPVMVSSNGEKLVSDATISEMKRYLFPLVDIVTPNIPEAELLIDDVFRDDMEEFARLLLTLGSRAVLLKGGHAGGARSDDVFVKHDKSLMLKSERIETLNNHGTGCTFSAALASYLAKGMSEEKAVNAAKIYITKALEYADDLDIGNGRGSVHHFFSQWN
ncbi:MAG: bifunctional hydroxymethylpyrimidine kinase/phosphomethylpyrimidine kinase [Alphaproteobacteria bacterium]|nr:bifunctional hydroxymethylpyrimidine kinase/phosphomethylpyrimidine kinase [Alphaproteobacteria bacterium]